MGQCVDTLQQETTYASKSKDKYQHMANVAAGVATTAMQSEVLSCLGVVPILAIILPIVLPLVALAAKNCEDRWKYKAEGAAMISEQDFNFNAF